MARRGINMLQYCAHLTPPPQTRQIEMDTNDPHIPPFNSAMRLNRSTWLKRRQIKRMRVVDGYPAPQQYRVTMPADAAGTDIELYMMPRRFGLDERSWQAALARTETAVGLLQCNDIRIDLVQHSQYPRGITLLVKADTFVDVIGCDL